MSTLPKIVVILGPTASGKTALSLKLAKEFKGEIISADSRQVYKYMDIGTAKEPGRWQEVDGKKVYMVDGVPHHLIDFLEPNEEFSTGLFKKKSLEIIKDILSRGKIPFVVGGTGLYISAITENLEIPKARPDKKLRERLENQDLDELIKELEDIDPLSAQQIDLKNKRRVVRALEVVHLTGKSFVEQQDRGDKLFEVLKIGIDIPRKKLYERINKRVDEQMKNGLLEETKKLVELGYSWGLPSMSGIGYKQMGMYLRGEVDLDEAIRILKRDTRHYAKKQLVWWRKDKEIKWVEGYKEARDKAKIFLG